MILQVKFFILNIHVVLGKFYSSIIYFRAFSYTFTVDENQTVSRNSALAAAAKNRMTTG